MSGRAIMVAGCLMVAQPAAAETEAERLKACSAITDDAGRLKCFDSLAARLSDGAVPESQRSQWMFTGGKSPVDDSPQVMASVPNGASGRDVITAWAARCRERKTEVILLLSGFAPPSWERTKLIVRVNQEKPQTLVAVASTDLRAVYLLSGEIAFLRSLPSSGKAFFRVFGLSGVEYDGAFRLDGIDEVRARIGAACKWPAEKPAQKPATAGRRG